MVVGRAAALRAGRAVALVGRAGVGCLRAEQRVLRARRLRLAVRRLGRLRLARLARLARRLTNILCCYLVLGCRGRMR